MGQLGNIACDNSCDRFLHGYDIVGFVHTGVFEGSPNDISVSSAHSCIYVRNRPLSPQAGGHAIFVKKHLKKHASIVLDRIEHGVVWIKVMCPQDNNKLMFVAFVYLPPQASTYYTQVGGLSFDEHFTKLQQDIMFFQDKGQVVLMGDFNARTGRMSEWDLLDPHELRHYTRPNIGDRKSRDQCVNSMGKKLIAMCESTGVFMMNGRSHADKDGVFSFQQIKGKGRSVIDYALVSRDLVDLGKMIDFLVVPIGLCPNRFGSGRYDHCPIVVRIGWQGVRRINNGNMQGQEEGVTTGGLRWRPQFRQLYTDIIQTDGIVLSHLVRAKDNERSVHETCDDINAAIARAAEVLHDKVGGVFIGSRKDDKHRRERWLSREAREIRKKMKVAECGLPHSRNVVQELRSMYRKQVKADRRLYLMGKRDKIRQDMVGNVKKFWAKFKKGRPVASAHNVVQWSEYFSKLFNEGKKEWDNQDVFETHCKQYENLFGSPSVDDMQGATCLNDEVQGWEVDKALKALNLGKAVGALI